MHETNSKYRKAYKIIKVTETKYQLCRVLNEYNTKEAADKALLELLTNSKTEKELLKEYSKKEI